jgi:hypothetical protein
MNNCPAAIATFASVLPIAAWLGRYQIRRVLGYLFPLSWASVQRSQFYMNHISDGTDLFVCECCFQQFNLLDLDVDYLESCHCTDPDSVMSFCNRCVRTYIENQVTADQAIRPVCMATRQCHLDDRLVRERLSAAALAIFDRNQVVQASRNSNDISVGEEMWHCPSPDCAFIVFVSKSTMLKRSKQRATEL